MECEVDNPPPSSVEDKNDKGYISTPFLCLHGVQGDGTTFSFNP